VAGRSRSIEKLHLIGTRSRDLPACSIVPQVAPSFWSNIGTDLTVHRQEVFISVKAYIFYIWGIPPCSKNIKLWVITLAIPEGRTTNVMDALTSVIHPFT
jgi:hypothetical protein